MKLETTVGWILCNATSDINYKTNIPLLTDRQLVFCLKREKRSSGRRQLEAELKRRQKRKESSS